MDAGLDTHLLSYRGSQCSVCESLFSQALRSLRSLSRLPSYVSRMREMGRSILQSGLIIQGWSDGGQERPRLRTRAGGAAASERDNRKLNKFDGQKSPKKGPN